MNAPSASLVSHRSGFTLLEILVVIGIIAVLTGLLFSGYQAAIAKGRDLQARASVRDLDTALQQYRSDYGRFPVTVNAPEAAISLGADSNVLKVLLGENPDQLNPQAHAYIEPKIGKAGAGGLIAAGGEGYALVDPWGEPYQIIVDSNYDHRVDNPDTQNEDAAIAGEALPFLPRGVLAFSKGADRKAHTRDDVVSWR